jgi:hypothetical protein
MSARPETGPMKFGDDWTGVFIRGDYAGPMAFYLSLALERIKAARVLEPLDVIQLEDLCATLGNSNEFGERVGLQQMKAFDECVQQQVKDVG